MCYALHLHAVKIYENKPKQNSKGGGWWAGRGSAFGWILLLVMTVHEQVSGLIHILLLWFQDEAFRKSRYWFSLADWNKLFNAYSKTGKKFEAAIKVVVKAKTIFLTKTLVQLHLPSRRSQLHRLTFGDPACCFIWLGKPSPRTLI